ncbi:MAG TPA: C1 family peptidase [Oscillospiraceae bacterium]|nr:C1 family peptidase [Oscillospiraceae bacterium]HPK35324.1 C1 family peptidase [Oscillospiraceae bacterium]HPR74660.1 C1 family peptidase [Oscillospiraceae bacterium]
MKKLIALFLAVSLLSLTLTGIPVSAQDTDSGIRAVTYQYIGTSPTGLNDYVLLDEDGNVIENKGLIENDNRDRALPVSFDLRNVEGVSYVTSVKNQGSYGTCWSFASVGALESNLIMQGIADTSIDLSELHTAWYAYTKDSVSGSTTYNDGKSYTGIDKYNAGGWSSTAYGLWGSAEGAQLDENALYSNASNTGFFTETQRKESYYRVKSAYEIPVNNTDAVKSSLVANGAMYLSFWLNWNCFNASKSTYYNPSYDYSNDPYSSSGGHAVLLVGWDDDYPASNFVTTPAGNGAWLCRNSWGTSSGDGGYFWISYYNHAITNFTTFIGTTNDNYDNYNQYERTGFPLALVSDEIYLANVFTANTASTLEAVAFRMESYDGTSGTPGFDYTIKIYKNLPTTVTNPTAGTLSASVSGHSNYGGYLTVDLSSAISLAAGTKYSIVISCKSTSAIYDGVVNFGAEKLVGTTLDEGTNSSAGISFWGDGVTWVDTYGTASISGFDFDGNFPIKALTDDVDSTYAATRALVQQQLDETEGCTQGTATADQWTAFTEARTLCESIVDDTTVSKADLNNAVIRMKVTRENAPGISYPTSADFTISVSNGIATVTAYTGTDTSVTVPKTLDGYTLSIISSTAFSGNTAIKTVYFEGNPSSISSTAFSGCTSLQFVYFMGNAPAVSGTIGAGSPIGVPTYYKNGTTGWTSSPWSGNATAVVPGDFNLDVSMNITDAVAFIQRLAQVGSYTLDEFAAIDITRDGSVNMADIVLLVQALANPAIELN